MVMKIEKNTYQKIIRTKIIKNYPDIIEHPKIIFILSYNSIVMKYELSDDCNVIGRREETTTYPRGKLSIDIHFYVDEARAKEEDN